MGLLIRTANRKLWYMNVDLDLDFGCSLLFLFYVYGWEMWHLSNFCVFNRFGYRARWTSAYVSSLHCDILSSCEQTPTGIFSIIGVWVKWIAGATGFIFWFPGGKRKWDVTLLYRWPYIIFWRCTTELSYLSCLLLFFETPELKMKWVLWESIGSCLRL